jgi:hypothetical protein
MYRTAFIPQSPQITTPGTKTNSIFLFFVSNKQEFAERRSWVRGRHPHVLKMKVLSLNEHLCGQWPEVSKDIWPWQKLYPSPGDMPPFKSQCQHTVHTVRGRCFRQPRAVQDTVVQAELDNRHIYLHPSNAHIFNPHAAIIRGYSV